MNQRQASNFYIVLGNLKVLKTIKKFDSIITRFDPEIVGGESIFADAFEIAELFRQKYPEMFLTLTKIPATFQKIHIERTRPVYMIYQRPHIALNHRHKVFEFFKLYLNYKN